MHFHRGRGLFICGNGVFYAESSKLGKVRNVDWYLICNPHIENEWVNPFGVQKYTTRGFKNWSDQEVGVVIL